MHVFIILFDIHVRSSIRVIRRYTYCDMLTIIDIGIEELWTSLALATPCRRRILGPTSGRQAVNGLGQLLNDGHSLPGLDLV